MSEGLDSQGCLKCQTVQNLEAEVFPDKYLTWQLDWLAQHALGIEVNSTVDGLTANLAAASNTEHHRTYRSLDSNSKVTAKP